MSEDQFTSSLEQLATMLSVVDARKLLDRLSLYRVKGRNGYPLEALWRAYLCSFLLSMNHTNQLIRRLQDDPALRYLCGFGDELPHRTTFNRFIRRLDDHRDLVEECLQQLTDQLAKLLPGFGEKVAVDSTTVRTHSNPNRKRVSDPDASWTAKTEKDKDGNDYLEWYFGYKYHALVCAKYGVPITGVTTTASCSDYPELQKLMDKARREHEWFGPRHLMADKGYDSRANHEAVIERGAIPIIAIRKPAKDKNKGLREGLYTADSRPTCIGLEAMQYVRSEPGKGHLFVCPPEGCRLRNRRGVRYCHEEEWLNRQDNPRLFSQVPRWSTEWKALYKLRQSVERVFKSMKESRRLESHCIRGLQRIGLHAAMSALGFQVTALVRILTGQPDLMRWMVNPIP